MNEFKQIPKALLHEIDKEGNIQTIDKKSPIFPHPMGGNNVILKMPDGERVPFFVSELVAEVFGEKPKYKKEEIKEVVKENKNNEGLEPFEKLHTTPKKEKLPSVLQEKSERAIDTAQMPSSGEVTHKKRGRIPKEKIVVSNNNPDIKKIMALDCFDSIKMWKLHQIGVSNEEITVLVNALHVSVIETTLEKCGRKDNLKI